MATSVYVPYGNPSSRQTTAGRCEATETKITVLESGLKVASENHYGNLCSIGVMINCGSRYEEAFPLGVSHLLEKLAFGSTQQYKDHRLILHEIEKCGGILDCKTTREHFTYATSIRKQMLNEAVKILGDAVLRPLLKPSEIEDARNNLRAELQDLDRRPYQAHLLLMEMIHTVAFRGNTLGLPKICPRENINLIGRTSLFTFMSNYFVPERMVLAGVGVDHEQFLAAVERYFVQTPPIWNQNRFLVLSGFHEVDRSVAQYTGGFLQSEKDVFHVSLDSTPSLLQVGHVVLGLKSCSHQDKDFIATSVLNELMGGGSSFSIGGPGKGMYSRLVLNVVHRHDWIHNAAAYNHSYSDSGIFFIHASSHPSKLGRLVDVITVEMTRMAGPIDEEDLRRAKRTLQSKLLMELERRPVILEDIAFQVLFTGERKRPEDVVGSIAAISEEDIRRVASQMLRSKPSVVVMAGDLRMVRDYSSIVRALGS